MVLIWALLMFFFIMKLGVSDYWLFLQSLFNRRIKT